MPLFRRRPRPLDIESRGRLNRTYRRPWNNWYTGLAGAAAVLNTAIGWKKNQAPPPEVERGRKRQRTGSSPSRSVLPTPSPSPAMRRRSRTRGRSVRRRRTSRRRSTRRRRSGSSSALSRQQDQRTQYTSSGRRRSNRGASGRRIQNALMKMQPLQTYTTKSTISATSNVNQIGMYGVGIFPTNMADQPDLKNIATDAGIPVATSSNSTSHFWIKNACLDVEIRNVTDEAVIMDVYTLLLVKDPETTDVLYAQFVSRFNQQVPLTSADPFDVSNSVFQNPLFCRYWKVLSKKEILLQPQEITALQMRRGKDKYVSIDDIFTNESGLPGTTKMYFFMWHGPPRSTGGSGDPPGGPCIGTSEVLFSFQKSYAYGQIPGPRTTAQIHNT